MKWHVQITEGDAKLRVDDGWATWFGCEDPKDKPKRDSTLGLHWGETLAVTVWFYTEATPRYPSGRPMCVDAVRFDCTKTEEHRCLV